MIKKKPYKTTVRVIFELPAKAADEAAAVVGDFNGWSADAGEMDYIKTRDVWKKAVSFKPGDRVEFRYLLDGETWKNEEEADNQVDNEYFEQNSVLEL
jgi:1,4-alpha-glucan branching enzyme